MIEGKRYSVLKQALDLPVACHAFVCVQQRNEHDALDLLVKFPYPFLDYLELTPYRTDSTGEVLDRKGWPTCFMDNGQVPWVCATCTG